MELQHVKTDKRSRTKSKPLAIESAHREVAHDEPQVGLTDRELLPAVLHLAAVVKAPDLRNFGTKLGSEQLAHRFAWVTIASGEDRDIAFQLAAVLEDHGPLSEVANLGARLELDLAVDNRLRGSNICGD